MPSISLGAPHQSRQAGATVSPDQTDNLARKDSKEGDVEEYVIVAEDACETTTTHINKSQSVVHKGCWDKNTQTPRPHQTKPHGDEITTQGLLFETLPPSPSKLNDPINELKKSYNTE